MTTEDMENLSDILRRIRDTRSANGGVNHRDDVPPTHSDEPEVEDVCNVCHGRKWLTFDVPAGHPDFGKVEPCECQADAVADERSARLRRYSNLGVLSRLTFNSTNPSGRHKNEEDKRMFAAAYETARQYAENPSGWLILTGPNGAGKTHLAAAIANHCIEQGRPVFFVHVPDLLDDLRSTYAPHSSISYSDLFEQVNDAPLLILDGLGTQSATPWAQEKLQQIFNRRSNAQLPTMVTTSMSISEIDPYISSRMTNPSLSRILELGSNTQEYRSKQFGRIPSEMLNHMTFDKFDVRGNNYSGFHRQSLEHALSAARAYASDPQGWLTLFGNTGVGKTHLAVAIAAECKRRSYHVVFTFVPELMDYLRQTFEPRSNISYYQAFKEIRDAPLLILDDLGSEYRNDWSFEKVYQIVVHRHNWRMPTVVTTRTNLAQDTSPIASRIQDWSAGQSAGLIQMDVPDYRVKH